MKLNPIFPPSRLTEPTRRAEQAVYQALEASALPGRALYEVKVTPRARQIDFLVLAEATAAFAVQLKGGKFAIQDGELCLNTGDGIIPKPGLLASVWDSAMAVPKFIERNLHRGMYIIPVLALPDMEQDEDILGMAARRNVEVLFGTDDWVNRLVGLASHHSIRHRPTEQTVEQEVLAIMPELDPAPTVPTPPQLVIQHVDQLHIHVGPEGVETLGIPDLTADG